MRNSVLPQLIIVAVIGIAAVTAFMLEPGDRIQGKQGGAPKNTVSIVLNVDSIDFGDLADDGINSTEDFSPPPFEIENNGKVVVNVEVTATDLWDSVNNPSAFYQFNSSEKEPNSVPNPAVDLVGPWTDLPTNETFVKVADNFKRKKKENEIYVNLRIQVPTDEGAGNKTSSLTFRAFES